MLNWMQLEMNLWLKMVGQYPLRASSRTNRGRNSLNRLQLHLFLLLLLLLLLLPLLLLLLLLPLLLFLLVLQLLVIIFRKYLNTDALRHRESTESSTNWKSVSGSDIPTYQQTVTGVAARDAYASKNWGYLQRAGNCKIVVKLRNANRQKIKLPN